MNCNIYNKHFFYGAWHQITENLSKSDIVFEQCRLFAKEKYVAAVCAAPSILAGLGLMKRATVHPDFKNHLGEAKVLDESIFGDGNIITRQGLRVTIPFALKLVETLVNKEKADKIAAAISFKG